eukprot:TRINITY_DN9135_c0_g1_i1.p2 TRINITY_DN9135_c0_g1~~TRINITY_DN9135_c0_g1_i1.p2  ORF type:complete len:102 (+),score=21.72 TRINITY_DN9135_c0_g1_i1:856-1161(+)
MAERKEKIVKCAREVLEFLEHFQPDESNIDPSNPFVKQMNFMMQFAQKSLAICATYGFTQADLMGLEAEYGSDPEMQPLIQEVKQKFSAKGLPTSFPQQTQ